MRLDTFILADAATASPDGKFNVLGAGLTRVEVPTLPFPMELSTVLRFEATDEEIESGEHEVLITLRGPTGQPNIAPLIVRLRAEAGDPLIEGEQRYLVMVLSVPGQAVREGRHQLEVELNGKQVGVAAFPVVVVESHNVIAVHRDPKVGDVPRAAQPATAKRPPAPPKKRSAKRKSGTRRK
jgi:hypothetical protein